MTAEEWIPGMVEVTQRDANNYCRVLTALGMEEEGDPVAEIERLRAENAALKREAHAWWTACRDATGEIERLRGVLLKIEAGEYLHLPTMVRDALGPNAEFSGRR